MSFAVHALQGCRTSTVKGNGNICLRRRDVSTAGLAAAVAPEDMTQRIRDLLRAGGGSQVGFGSMLGFATGYTVKRVGQILLVFIGMEVIALQLMSNHGWVVVNWPKITRDLSPHVEKGSFERVFDALKMKAPFAGSFSVGCYAGLNWS